MKKEIIKIPIKVIYIKDYRDDEREFFNKLSKKQQKIWEGGVNYAVKRIKELSWYERLFNKFN